MKNENGYLQLLSKVLFKGQLRSNRTGTNTLSLFGKQIKYDLRNGKLPIFTSKTVNYKMIIDELLFFLSGSTDTKILKSNIWKGNTSKEFLQERGLSYEEGDMGPGYGFQWRHWGETYEGCNPAQPYEGIDQIQNLIEMIKNNPYDRRLIVSAWNVGDLSKMALPPCHCFFQLYPIPDTKEMDLMLYQRSADMFLGVPFNVTSYSLLLYIICHLTGYTPRYFIHNMGDTHIYENHKTQVSEQLSRIIFNEFPDIELKPFTTLDELTEDHFIITNYKPLPPIRAPMAV